MGYGINGPGYHLSMCYADFNCPNCGKAYDNDWYYKQLEKAKRGYIEKTCTECKKKIGIAIDMTGDVQVWLHEDTVLIDHLHKQGYSFMKRLHNRGMCGVQKMIFNWTICVGMDYSGVTGRFFFDDGVEAQFSLRNWRDGLVDPPGNWIKYKGEKGEYMNPNYKSDDEGEDDDEEEPEPIFPGSPDLGMSKS
jgi:hypothetical protein